MNTFISSSSIREKIVNAPEFKEVCARYDLNEEQGLRFTDAALAVTASYAGSNFNQDMLQAACIGAALTTAVLLNIRQEKVVDIAQQFYATGKLAVEEGWLPDTTPNHTDLPVDPNAN